MRVRAQQRAHLVEAAVDNFRRRVAAYLRRHLPQQTSALSEPQLLDKVRIWHDLASSYSVSSERAIAKWCYLSLVTSDHFPNDPEFRAYWQSMGSSDEKLDRLMRVLAIRLHLSELERR